MKIIIRESWEEKWIRKKQYRRENILVIEALEILPIIVKKNKEIGEKKNSIHQFLNKFKTWARRVMNIEENDKI